MHATRSSWLSASECMLTWNVHWQPVSVDMLYAACASPAQRHVLANLYS